LAYLKGVVHHPLVQPHVARSLRDSVEFRTGATVKVSARKQLPIVRIARLTNPKTKRASFVRLTAAGHLVGARYQHIFGVRKVATWTEVAAKSWKEATKLVRAGKGKTVNASKGAS